MKKKTATRKKKRAPKRDTFDRLADLVGKFLDENGWKTLVVGPASIRKDPTAMTFNYELVIGFTGIKKEVKHDTDCTRSDYCYLGTNSPGSA